MAPVLNSNVFKCVMPIFGNEMVSSLPGNTKHIIHKLGNTILSSVYNTFNGGFSNGYLVDNTNCNWKNIDEHLERVPNDLSVLNKQCSGTSVPIHNINENNLILEQVVTPYQNGTANIFGQDYTVNGNMFAKDTIVSFLGLEDCSVDTAKDKLQEYYDYLQSLIPTTTTTTEAPISLLNKAFGALGISADDFLSPAELGKYIFNILNKPFTDPTTTESPNDDTNDGGYWGYIIGAAGCIAASAIAAKYGWDWYKGRTIEKENSDLINKNEQLKQEYSNLTNKEPELRYIKLLHEFFKSNACILDEITKINNLDDIVKLARSNDEYKSLIPQINNLNNEIVKLNSPSTIVTNLGSSSGILHEICNILNGTDHLDTIKSFATLITTIRTANSISEEYKESITEIFKIFQVDETSSEQYHYINEESLPAHDTPLLAESLQYTDSQVEC